MFRTMGPRTSAAQDAADAPAIRHCRKCNPPAKTYKCPVCDYETGAQWCFRMHLKFNPQWCQERGKKKARNWAKTV